VRNGIKFISSGQESHLLIYALSKLYYAPVKNKIFKHKMFSGVFSLNEKEVDFDKNDYFKFK
jgi:hypothetical protein